MVKIELTVGEVEAIKRAIDSYRSGDLNILANAEDAIRMGKVR